MDLMNLKEGKMSSEPNQLNTIAEGDKPANMDNGDKVKTTEEKELPSPENGDDLESVLNDLKLFGRYHVKFLFLIVLLCINSAQHSINYMFSVENVDYRCKYSNCERSELSKLEPTSTTDYKCHKYDLFNRNGPCTADNFDTSNATDCTEWVYDNPNTFVAEFNLACEDWKRTLVGTMHSIGFMIGLLLIGPMSDKIGRKRLIIFNIVTAGVIGVSKSLVRSYWVFITLEMLEPMLGECYAATFTMAIEMVTKKHRPTIIFLLAMATASGQILLAVAAYFTPNWRIFLASIYAPSLLFILYIFWLDESLRWQLNKGKKAEAEQTIKRAAKMNNIKMDDSRIVNLNCEENSTNASWITSIKVTFSSKKLVVRLLICICMWFTSLFNAYALMINSVSLEGNKYINYGLVALAGAVGGVILLYVLTKFRRKGPLIFSLTLTGLFCVTQSFIPKDYRWLSTLLYICGKMNASISVRISYLYTTELFPTYTRNTMLALCSSLGRLGPILAPQTPLLLKYWSGLPSLLVGILSLMTASVVTLMPDTSEDVLPENVKEAEAVGNRQKMKEMCF